MPGSGVRASARLAAIALVLAAPARAGADSYRVEGALRMDGGYTESTGGSGPSPWLEASLGATLYLHRVDDDATPLGLQPFLQRAGHARLIAGGFYHNEPIDGIAGDPAQALGGGRIAADVEAYVSPWVALRAAAAWRATRALEETAGSRDDVRLDAAVVVRPPGDAALAIVVGGGADVVRLDETASPATTAAGHAQVGLRAVLLEHIDVDLGLEVGLRPGPRALAAWLRTAYYPSRRLGLYAGGAGGGTFGDDAPDTARLSLLAGASLATASGRFGVALDYAPGWATSPRGGRFEHRLALTLLVRGL